MAFEEIQDSVWYIVFGIIILSIIIVFAISFQPSLTAGWVVLIGNAIKWLIKPVV